MSGISNAISDILYGKVLEDLKLSGRSGDVFYKLQAIKSAKERGITPIAKIFDISRVTLMNWIWSYESNGIDGLRIKAGRGRKPIINVDEEGIIKIWLEQDNTITIKKLRARIKQELEKEIGKSATHGLMKRLGFSYITPRPRHYKQDKQKQEEFKKNLQEKLQANPDNELFFFDESRFGTHSKVGHGWFKKGARNSIRVKLGFESFYVYSAVNPRKGEDFSMFMPNVNSECFNIYLEEFSKFLGNREVIFVLDGASWHQAQRIKKPSNIEFVFLPPYSPELNPVERFWQYIKNNTIKNKLFDNLKSIENEIYTFIKGITRDITASVCHLNYVLS